MDKGKEIKTYGDIIEEIMNIIAASEKKKSEMTPEELKENFNEHFACILYCDIDINLASYFKELIDAERTFTKLKTESPLNCLDKTRQLLYDCKENALPNSKDYFVYEEIAQIINESYGKSAFDLTEYKGYYILRERLNRFLWLMRKVNMLPDESKMTEEQRKEEVNKTLAENKEQYNRLREYIEKAKKISYGEDISKPQVIDINKTVGIRPNFRNKSHGDLILLGINGTLTAEMVEKLRISYSNEQYQNLLDELLEWEIFSKEEIEKLRNAKDKGTTFISGMDELFMFFATKKITDANAIRLLAPAIGKENCRNLVDSLYQVGAIPQEIYEQYLTLEFGVDTKIMKKA